MKKLKEMLSIHLDIVQHQMDESTFRESQMKALRKENQMLLQKMERMERKLMAQHLAAPHQKRPHCNTITPLPPAIVTDTTKQQQEEQQRQQSNHSLSAKNATHASTESASVAAAGTESVTSLVTSSATSRSTQTSPERVTELRRAGKKKVGRRKRRCFCVVRNRLPNGSWSRVLPLPTPSNSPLPPSSSTPRAPPVPVATAAVSPHSPVSTDQCVGSRLKYRRTSRRTADAEISSHTDPTADTGSPVADSPATTPDAEVADADVKGVMFDVAVQSTGGVQTEQRNFLLQDESMPDIPSCMLTQVLYHVTADHCTRLSSRETKQLISDSRQAIVEVPCWHVSTLTPAHATSDSAGEDAGVSSSVECLADDTFLRRHSKPELNEKRRKRWDLQRMRQQHQYEKLRSAYQRRNNTTTSTNTGSAGSELTRSETNAASAATAVNVLSAVAVSAPPVRQMSLCPQPGRSTYMVIERAVPVCCFGANLPNLRRRGFGLPWKTDRSSL